MDIVRQRKMSQVVTPMNLFIVFMVMLFIYIVMILVMQPHIQL